MKPTKRIKAMCFKKTITTLIAMFIFSIPLSAQEITKINSDSPLDSCEILFIGSSYFNFNNLPNLFENLAINAGKEVYIDQYIPSGLYLSDHAKNSTTEAKINEEDWDYVILQGVGSVTAYPDSFTTHPVYPALVTLQNKIYANCESTKMVFCLPWAFEDGMTWYGWPDTYEDMQIKIYDNTLLYSNDLDFPVAPVGWAWYAVLDELNYPLHYLHLSDWNHPSLKGSYLMACVIFSSVYLEDCIGNTFTAELPEEEAIHFQTVGSNTVLNSLELWNITPNTGICESSIPNNVNLQQNCPNPFTSHTIINYKVLKGTFVKIIIYDNLDNICETLVNEYRLPGNYSIVFDRNKLKNGIYYYQVSTDGHYQVKKMLLVN